MTDTTPKVQAFIDELIALQARYGVCLTCCNGDLEIVDGEPARTFADCTDEAVKLRKRELILELESDVRRWWRWRHVTDRKGGREMVRKALRHLMSYVGATPGEKRRQRLLEEARLERIARENAMLFTRPDVR